MKIPNRLQQDGIRFVLLERSGKKPIQKDWTNKTILYDNAELINHISNGGNYGVMGGGSKQLLILDFDNEKVQDEVCLKLPRTFTIKTGSGKLHKYFFSDGCISFKIFDENLNTLVDIQGEGKQVVAPNSIHPNGNRYEVFDDTDISFLTYSEIKALLLPYDKKVKKEKKEYEKPKGILTDDFLDTLKSNLNMEDVLSSIGINTSINPTQCPKHSSKGGKCLGFNRETAHCFHCDGSWNIFSLIKDYKNCDFKEALQYLSNIAGLEEEYEKSKRKYIENIKETEQSKKKELKYKFLELVSGEKKKWGEATELLVNYILKNNYIYTTKEDNQNETWIYKEGVYVPQGKSEIKMILRNILDNVYSHYVYGLVLNKIEVDTFIDLDEFFKERYINEVPVKNGILNIYSKEIKPFSPEKIFFNKMPVEYNPNSKCPQIEKFLGEVLPVEEDKEVFYELGGFCLMNEYKYEKAFMFVGNGRNGKDKSLELIKRLLGVENCSAVPLQQLNDDFVLSELFEKKVNLAGDISNQDLKETNMFKASTGRSLLSAKRKYLSNISFINKAKFIFACNELPMVYDTSRGFWDRWILLQFPNTFVTKEELEQIKEKKLFKLKDDDIISKITAEEEMSGLLNKFLEGLDRLTFNKKFSQSVGTEEIKTLWIRKSNSFVAFCMDNLEEDYGTRVSKKELRKKYIEFCKLHKVVVKSGYVIKRTLEETFGVDDGFDGTDRYWEGVKFKK